MRKQLDRWELTAPFDALSWALCLKNRRAARAILEEREALTWLEGSEYAPLTLGWAPELLEMILDRVPAGEEELFCVRSLFRPGDGMELLVESSLLTAAAAVDDLAAVELLLARGNCALDEGELYNKIHRSPHYHELEHIRNDLPVKRADDEMVFLLDLGLENIREGNILTHIDLDRAGPLSSAILCGAKRCALRLLEEGTEITSTVRSTMTMTQLLEDEGYRAAVEAVTSAVGAELPDLLEPAEFDDWKHPLFPECVKRHAADLSLLMISYVFARAAQEEWAREVLRQMDPLRLSDWLRVKFAPRAVGHSRWLQDAQWFFSDQGPDLVLDRNAIPSQTDMDALLFCLEHARVVGTVPKGALSSLTVRLLDDIIEQSSKGKPDIIRPGAGAIYRAILRDEDSNLIRRYLEEKGCGNGSAFFLVLALVRASRARTVNEEEAV